MPKLVFVREGHDQTVKTQIWHMDDKELQLFIAYAIDNKREVVKSVDITQHECDVFPIQYLEYKYGKEFLGV